MAEFSEKFETINEWLEILTPITTEEFCQRWIPQFFEVQIDNKKEYRKACVILLMKLTKKQHKTVQNWITYPNTVPDDVKSYLGVVDLLWRFRWEARVLFPEMQKLQMISSVLQTKISNLEDPD